MVLMRLFAVVALLSCLVVNSPAQAQEPYVLKFATLAPPGSTWMVIIDDWARQVEKESRGRLVFKLYPGGVAGDEPDVVRKIRFNQLQGGAFSGNGIGHMYSPARVLEIPFLYQNTAEVDHVRGHITQDLEAGFRNNGYHLLGWMEIGYVRFFSREPIHSFDDMRKRRVWHWQGDQLSEAFFKASNISPIPLSINDVYTSLSTGMIDTAYSTALAAIAMQWFTKTAYVTDAPMSTAMGALLVSRKFHDGLPADLQSVLSRTGRATGERLIAQARIDNDKSVAVLKQNGLKFVFTEDEVAKADLTDIRLRATRELVQAGYIPQALMTRTQGLLDEYRRKIATGHKVHAAGP
jgi:TRAP-type C4-dicarboxylate transport system substrate-binding protein